VLWSPNTQLHYPFQNTAKDYSGNARDGTVNGSGVYATKPNGGRCLYFDGVGDYVATPSFGLSGTVVVFAADVRCKYSADDWQLFLGEAAQSQPDGVLYCRRTKAENDLFWIYRAGTVDQYVKAVDYFAAPYNDAWLHMIVVCDYSVGGSIYFYRNGILFYSVPTTGTPVFPSTARVKYIGSYSATQYLLIQGYLANVQLWTLATMPTAAQMLANANRIMLGMNPIW